MVDFLKLKYKVTFYSFISFSGKFLDLSLVQIWMQINGKTFRPRSAKLFADFSDPDPQKYKKV